MPLLRLAQIVKKQLDVLLLQRLDSQILHERGELLDSRETNKRITDKIHLKNANENTTRRAGIKMRKDDTRTRRLFPERPSHCGPLVSPRAAIASGSPVRHRGAGTNNSYQSARPRGYHQSDACKERCTTNEATEVRIRELGPPQMYTTQTPITREKKTDVGSTSGDTYVAVQYLDTSKGVCTHWPHRYGQGLDHLSTRTYTAMRCAALAYLEVDAVRIIAVDLSESLGDGAILVLQSPSHQISYLCHFASGTGVFLIFTFSFC